MTLNQINIRLVYIQILSNLCTSYFVQQISENPKTSKYIFKKNSNTKTVEGQSYTIIQVQLLDLVAPLAFILCIITLKENLCGFLEIQNILFFPISLALQ